MLRTIIVDHNPLFGDAGIAALAGGLPRTFGRGAGFPGEAATMVLFFVRKWNTSIRYLQILQLAF